MFGRVTVSRTPDLLTQKTIKPEVTIASTQWQLDTEYLVNGQTELRQRLEENQQSTSEYWAKYADYRRWLCQIHATTTSMQSPSAAENSKQQERLEHCAMQSQRLFVQTKRANQLIGIKDDSPLNFTGGEEQIVHVSKSASNQKRPSALN